MRRPLWILGALALAAVLAIGISQAGGPTQEKTSGSATLDLAKLEGSPPPLADLHEAHSTIRDATTKTFREQLKDLRGYPVVVNAWAAWCGPCKLEFPIFRKVATDRGKKIAFLGLNVSDNRQDAERFLRREPVPYPSLEDGDARIAQSAGATGGLPTTIFYDADGKRSYIHQGGYASEDDLLSDIKRHLGA